MNIAAHELLETSEALRTKAAEIEQHGQFINQCSDQQLRSILAKHQQRMMFAYQQGITLLQGRGTQVAFQTPNFTTPNDVYSHHQVSMSAPMASVKTISDQTIATLALNAHKSGSMMGMQWANECVDPQLRTYHVNGALLCQEMAYEIWTWMNQNGYYQPPTFTQDQTMQMTGMFQPMAAMNYTSGIGVSPMGVHNPLQ